MSPAKIKINPEKMTRKVQRLFELSIVKNLSPYKLAPLLHVSPQQIYRWYSGDVPKAGSEALIDAGIETVNGLPDQGIGWGRLWINDTPERRKQEEAERKFHAQMGRIFHQLQNKITPADKALLAQEEPAWTGFEEMLLLLKKYHVKLPK